MPDTKLSDLIAHSAPEDGGEPQLLDDHLRGMVQNEKRQSENRP